jgi:hypothetical protein
LENPLVVHCRLSRYDVYIGRPSKWGNPFVVGRDGAREQVIARYEQWLLTQPHLIAALGELTGKILACWCAPQPCHGDVLARLADQDTGRRQLSEPGEPSDAPQTHPGERWIWVSLPYATFALVVSGGRVVDAAPIARKSIGRDERQVAAYYRRRGASFAPLPPATGPAPRHRNEAS